MAPHLRFVFVVGTAALALTLESVPSAHRWPQRPSRPLVLTHGIASGDVTASSAVIWGRANERAQMHVEADTEPAFRGARSRGSAPALEAKDFTAHVTLEGLKPDTRYWYRVWLERGDRGWHSDASPHLIGTFKTAPAPWQSRPISFVVGADLGGQGFCRNAALGPDGQPKGYAIFATMEALRPAFFIANGDMIYADAACPADGPGDWQNIPGDFPNIADPSVDWTQDAVVRDVFWKHYRYNRADPHYQSFLRRTPTISQWDDHEVINDFGAPWSYWNAANINRPGYPNLVEEGLDAFFAYSAIRRNRSERDRIYRSFRWGRDVEVFVLDARSYRDRNELPDTPENRKDMLGREQVAWLVDGIQKSTATWKIVSSDVPISIGTGPQATPTTPAGPRDAWANIGAEPTGFERELLRLLRRLDRVNAENLVFVTTDVHFAQTIQYETDADGDGDTLRFHELISGPLNAGTFAPRALDPAANPTSLYSETGFFNFSYIRVARQRDGEVHLIADVRGENGVPRPGSHLDLTPR
jgi:alkaline phosphatase D